ncbi:MAG: hypothetical protein ABI583_15580, partial [Betaproteobacteria bacterium]
FLSINRRPKRIANDAPEVIAENLKVMRENQISWREANETAIQESPFIATDSSQTRIDACLCP